MWNKVTMPTRKMQERCSRVFVWVMKKWYIVDHHEMWYREFHYLGTYNSKCLCKAIGIIST